MISGPASPHHSELEPSGGVRHRLGGASENGGVRCRPRVRTENVAISLKWKCALRTNTLRVMASSWLKRTGQTWKVVVFGVLVIASLVLLALMIAAVNGKIEGEVAFAFVGAGFCAFLWLATAIRCSRCGARPAWHLMRTAPQASWFSEFLALDRCPSCGK